MTEKKYDVYFRNWLIWLRVRRYYINRKIECAGNRGGVNHIPGIQISECQ